MGDGTEQSPYTHADVLKAIEKNGGTARGLDLSGKVFEEGIDLRELNLEEIILKEAELWFAHLEGAALSYAHLERVTLMDVKISSDTRLEYADWGNYILGEEIEGDYYSAEDTYRMLKMWHTNAGVYDVAGEFFFREITARRKMLKWWPNPFARAGSKFLSIFCGYGEKWHRVIISAAVVVLGLALIYFAIGTLTPNSFLNSLYYSAVSFTALGYGSWAPQPTGWVKGLGAFEAFIGVFMIALFLVTFFRKWTR